MSDAGRQPADRLELVRHAELGFDTRALLHLVGQAAIGVLELPGACPDRGLQAFDLRADPASKRPLRRQCMRALYDLDGVEWLLQRSAPTRETWSRASMSLHE